MQPAAPTTDILVIQSSLSDPLGILETYLSQGGATLCFWVTEQAPEPPAGDYSGLVILGGPMNAHEDERFPHLVKTVNLIHQFHQANKPILGICLGAQLIARACGQQVGPHRVPELGFSPVWLTEAGAQEEPWLKKGPADLSPWYLMQWHFDTFALPAGAIRLMTNEVCENQAFRIGRNIYGFQFHPEVTPEIVQRWFAEEKDWLVAHFPEVYNNIQQQIAHHAEQSFEFAQRLSRAWLSLLS